LLASVAVFVAAAASTAASNAAGWGNPIVIGLLAAALLCLIGSVAAFKPTPSGNAKMNRLIRRQFRSLKRRRARPAMEDDRLAVATYGEEQRELQRRAEQHAKENVDLQDRRAR
jgi:hypothetical protein